MFFLQLTKKKNETKNEPYNKSQIYDSLENLFYANKFFVRTARTETNHVTNFMECILYVHSDWRGRVKVNTAPISHTKSICQHYIIHHHCMYNVAVL